MTREEAQQKVEQAKKAVLEAYVGFSTELNRACDQQSGLKTMMPRNKNKKTGLTAMRGLVDHITPENIEANGSLNVTEPVFNQLRGANWNVLKDILHGNQNDRTGNDAKKISEAIKQTGEKDREASKTYEALEGGINAVDQAMENYIKAEKIRDTFALLDGAVSICNREQKANTFIQTPAGMDYGLHGLVGMRMPKPPKELDITKGITNCVAGYVSIEEAKIRKESKDSPSGIEISGEISEEAKKNCKAVFEARQPFLNKVADEIQALQQVVLEAVALGVGPEVTEAAVGKITELAKESQGKGFALTAEGDFSQNLENLKTRQENFLEELGEYKNQLTTEMQNAPKETSRQSLDYGSGDEGGPSKTRSLSTGSRT